jgi:hypothetical protein
VFAPAVDFLLRNNGDATFTDVSAQAGIRRIVGAGLGVVAADLNVDGWPDIYVANDGYANQLWVNQGDGTFRDEALVRGAAYSQDGVAEAGMGVLAADLDDDLDLDLFMTHLANETNTLYANLGGRRGFEDRTGASGLASSSLVYTGFGAAATDIESDGDLDLVVVNGRVTHGNPRPASVGPPWDRFAEPNQVYLNQGGGRFEVARGIADDFSTPVEVSRSLAVGDIDSDGDTDLLLGNVHHRARLYRNEAPRRGTWLVVRAVDPRLRRDAIGARVTVVRGEIRRVRTITPGFSYLSSSDPRAHFGLGTLEELDRIEVRWPDGLLETFPSPAVNRQVTLVRGAGESEP